MFFDHYPYTNFHNINLDWVLQAVKSWGQTVEANDQAFRDLKEANESFKAYVTNYLQDLDVSDEINAKLDAMLAAGTLTPYFRPYIASEVGTWLSGHITPTTPALDNTLKVVNAAAESSHTGEALNDLAYTALRGQVRELKAIVPRSIAPGYRIQSIVRNYTNGKYYFVGGSNAHDGTGVIIKADGPDLSGAVVTVVDQLGHANDVTYYDGFLYVCTAGNNGAAEGNAPLNKVWKIDVNDFTSKTLVTGTPDGIYGITYDYGRFYMLANNHIYYSDTEFSSLTVAVDNIYSFTDPGNFPASGRLVQGLFTYCNHVIGLVSDYVVEGTHNGAITFFTRRGLMIAARTFESVNAEVQGACTGTNGNIIVVTSNETELSTVLIQRLFDRDYEIIPSYADLDDYRATGTYYCNVRETAGSLTHCPTTEAFTLKVARLGMLHVSQEITDQQARVYIRVGNGRTGAWGEWTDEAGEIAEIKTDLIDIWNKISLETSISGNMVHLNGVRTGQEAEDVIIKVMPIQDGTGTPSETNVRAISGRSSVTITQIRKNILASIFSDGYVPSISNGQLIHAQGVRSDYIPANGSTLYTLTIERTSGSKTEMYAFFYDKDKNYLLNSSYPIADTTTNTLSFVTPPTTAFIMCRFGLGNDLSTYIKAQLEFGDNSTTYNEYNATQHTVDISDYAPVYGAILNVTQGTLTITHGYIESYAGESITGPWISNRDVYSDNTSPSPGAQVVYPLTTPIEYNITPQAITLFEGINNICSDSGETSVLISGVESIADKVAELAQDKIDKQQGAANAGKVLVVGSDGIVSLVDPSLIWH